MSSNTIGTLFRVTTFGESHGPALGVVVDGCPPGIPLELEDLLPELARRRPGQSDVTTARKESDAPEILSGLFEGLTTGMPITVIVRNEGQRSKDYSALKNSPRPGHADSTYAGKYGHRDYRGGGRSSGRETVARVIAGVIARKVLPAETQIVAHALQIGPHRAETFDAKVIEQNAVRCGDPVAAAKMESYVRKLRDEHDSIGGLVEVILRHLPPHLGEPVFDKLKARLGHAMLGVGAVTGFSYGAGFESAEMRGTEYVSNAKNFGGILGGISSGEDVRLVVSIKPTTSIANVAKKGRHDPCIVPRVIPVLEAMAAIALADAFLIHKARASG